ncbi:ATP-grasp domain-containing protein [Streptomyces sp. HUAS TT20]|uniref:ATP-grasp domain-containing protein n=1 Tax=Streptomyces sp. HUAS TT20 TaxID=3447509 RepID=UPI0021DB2682|nr:ATP-grasp domain-containing protein [Streptomyces sp. HUAS 15-9]UXY28485.1 ATP-grasp domain-containing protein [Streptomyces sp. HUAS 15-9]
MAEAESCRHLVLVDAPGGPQVADIVNSLAGLATCTVVSLRWGSPAEHARRVDGLRALGPVDIIERADQVVDALLAVAAGGRPIDGVLAFSEIVSYHAAVAAAALRLPANSPQATIRLRRKDLQRQALSAAGVPCPEFAVVTDEDELEAASSRLAFPVVLKPAIGVGSLCVTRAEDRYQLAEAFARASRQYRDDPRVNGASPVFVVEEVIQGDNWHADERMGTRVSVESLLDADEIHHLAVTDKLPLAPPFREVGDVMPSGLPEQRRAEILDVTTRALRALGATSGATHTELMLTSDGPVIIEVNGRIGGGVFELLRTAAAYDMARQQARIALGERLEELPLFSGYAAFVTPQPPSGDYEILSVGGREEIAAVPGVVEVIQTKSAGAVLAKEAGTNAHTFRVLAAGREPDEFFTQLKAIEDSIQLELGPAPSRGAQEPHRV